ncbi:MAG TPA: ROK family protein [Steroidobacteraceae bacterium]|jgi:polyphosphate glucokinase|nr:ROK family protein [Steroidobacteraceae bacterium]
MSQNLLGIDVGGSSVKAGVVDVTTGQLLGEMISAPTPRPSTPDRLAAVIAGLAKRLPQAKGSVGVAFPSVVRNGVIRTAANIDHSWLGADGATVVGKAVNRPVVFLNDADAAGIAEMRWGAGKDLKGTAIMLTFGTGIGSALFVDGRLFPNTELGHMELNGKEAEKFASAHVRTAMHLDFPAWIERVNVYLARMQALFWPDVIILGGAVSERYAEFSRLLKCDAQLRPAHFAGQAGVIGAAMASSEAS